MDGHGLKVTTGSPQLPTTIGTSELQAAVKRIAPHFTTFVPRLLNEARQLLSDSQGH